MSKVLPLVICLGSASWLFYADAHYGLVNQSHLARWQISGHTMGRVESGGVAGECHFLFPFFCSVVCDRKTEAGGSADGLLVVEPGRLFAASELRPFLPARFGVHFCLRFHLDSIYPQSHHPPAARGRARGLPAMCSSLSAPIQLLFGVRREDQSGFVCENGNVTAECKAGSSVHSF